MFEQAILRIVCFSLFSRNLWIPIGELITWLKYAFFRGDDSAQIYPAYWRGDWAGNLL